MSQTYSAGVATAYGAALRGGYTGTYAQFCAALGNLAEVLDDFGNFSVTISTLPAGASATASYADGVLSLGIPKGDTGAPGTPGEKGDKGDKGDTGETGPAGATGNGIASIEKTGTEGLVDTYTITYTDGTTTTFTVTNGRDFDPDGYYEGMTVGVAEQLATSKYTEDKTPYLFRTSGGSADIGNREEDTIIGGSVAWNQQFKIGSMAWSSAGYNGVFITKVDDGTFLVKGTASANMSARACYMPDKPVANHVYYINSGDSRLGGYIGNAPSKYGEGIVKPTSVNDNAFLYGIVASTDFGTDGIEVKPQLTDLTQMFGSTIADLAYSKEQASAGSGVNWLKSSGFFVKNYHPYDAGTMKSVEGLVSHDMVGFNQWDEQWELGYYDASNGNKVNATNEIRSKNLVHVLPNTAYYGTGFLSGASCVYFDADENYVGWSRPIGAFTTPNNAYYMALNMGNNYGVTYKNDTCINLSWSGYRNGEYQPYVKHSYPLDSTLTLRGFPKVDASGNLYYNGDIYHPDGRVERWFPEVDLGTLNWTADSNRPGVFYSSSLQTIIKNISPWADLICSKYTLNKTGPNDLSDKQISSTNAYGAGNIFIKDSAFEGYTGAQVASALSGVMLIYEVATPTTESATPYTTPQIVDDFGTEEYVIDSEVAVPVPVGHATKYPENLREKIEGLPKDFSTLIAPTEEGYKATRAYSTGALFIVDNILYKATTSIASGATITPGTNCTQTTLAAVIAALA